MRFKYDTTEEEQKEDQRANENMKYATGKRQLKYVRRKREEAKKLKGIKKRYDGTKSGLNAKKTEKEVMERLRETAPYSRARVGRKEVNAILKAEAVGKATRFREQGTKHIRHLLCITGGRLTGRMLCALHLKYHCGADMVCTFTRRPPTCTEVEGREHHFVDIRPPEEDILFVQRDINYKSYATLNTLKDYSIVVVNYDGLSDLYKRSFENLDIVTVRIMRKRSLRYMFGYTESDKLSDLARERECAFPFDYTIENNGTKKELFESLEKIYAQFMERR
jgi:hypothetical protein